MVSSYHPEIASKECDLIFEMTMLLLIGPSSPSMPIITPASSLFHNRATVQWHVSSVTYDPESYVVEYGLSEANLSLNSSLVTSGMDITLINFITEVELTNLMVNTIYFYHVVSSNSVGTATSIISSFTTTELREFSSPILDTMYTHTGHYEYRLLSPILTLCSV